MKPFSDPFRAGSILLWCVGLLLSGWAAWSIQRANQVTLDERVRGVSAEIAEQIQERFALYEYGLRGARGAIAASGGVAVTRQQFEAYMDSRDATTEFPGARGFGFIRRVPKADVAAFLAAARADGRPDFTISELAPNEADRFVIQYIYPEQGNEGTSGLDIASEFHRREAALIAARAAQARITAPITLVQASGEPGKGLLMLLPVYATGQVPTSPGAREAATVGWVYAPLLLDDVLADLGSRAHELNLSVSEFEGNTPFFTSVHGQVDNMQIAPASMFLNVYGQAWTLTANATPALVRASHLTSPIEVGLGGAGVTSVLALLLFMVGQNRRTREAALRQREFGSLSRGQRSLSPLAFARSPLAIRSLLVYGLGVVALGVWQYQYQLDKQLRSTDADLGRVVNGMAQFTEERREFRSRSLRFLASTPPVQGLVRALQNKGIDPTGGSTSAEWEQRLQQIFTGYLGSSPEVRRLRFLHAADNGKELVRVEQRDSAAMSIQVPAGSLSAHDTAFLAGALRQPPGGVLVSDIELHRQHGALSVPHWPTVRYATPVFDEQGRAIGAIVLDVDVRGALDGFVQRNASGLDIYMTNAQGDYLVHPDASKVFGFEFGLPHKWTDEFRAVVEGGTDNNVGERALTRWSGPNGKVFGAQAVLQGSGLGNVGTLHFMVTVPVSRLYQAAWADVRNTALLLLIIGLAGVTMLYLYWVSMERALQARSERLRLAAIVDQTTDAIIGLDTAGVVLSWNRGAEQLFGYTAEEAIGQHLDALTLPEDAEPDARPILGRSSAALDRAPLEVWRRTRDGRRVEVSITLSPLTGNDGTVAGAAAIVRDITEERAAQRRVVELNTHLEQQVQERTASLQAERQRLDNILRGTHAGTWEWNVQTGEKLYNERWAEMLGYTLAELGTLSHDIWLSLAHPEDQKRADARLQSHFNGVTDQYECELRMRHKDGHWVWILDRGRLTSRTADGRPEWLHGTHTDVTQAHQAQERLASNEELLDRTGRVAGIGGWQFELATWSVTWTPPMYDICEVYPDYQPEPNGPLDFFAESELPRVVAALRAVRKEGTPFDMEVPFVTAQGRHLQVRFVGEAIRNTTGEVIRVVGALQDVTARHAMDAEMRRINELQLSILENMPCALSAFDADLRLVAWNQQFVSLLSLESLFEKGVPSFEDILRLNASRGEYGDGPVEPKIQEMLERARHPVPHRFERVRPNGTPLEVRGTPMPGGGFVTTYTDMSERKRAEQDIARSEALLRGAIEAVDEAFVLYDPDDRLVLCNEKYRSLYEGIRDVLLPGQQFEHIIRTSAERGFQVLGDESLDDWIAERMAAHRSGDAYFVQRLSNGRVVRVIERQLPDGHTVGFRIDITDLVRATDAAEAASQAKGEFLANMSHEIRTPLHAVIGLTHLLADTPLSAHQQQLLDKSLMASRSLLGIVNDVLDLAKIEAGELTLLPEPFLLDSLVNDLDNLFREQSKSKGVHLVVERSETLPAVLVGDAMRLRQILNNLTGNAFKFTQHGSVRVRLSGVPAKADDPPGSVRLRGEVQDSGVGISPEVQARLFTPFTQADASTTRQFGGTGLGLSIVRQMAEAMGGSVGLHSVVGEGSSFWFELPLSLPEADGAIPGERRQASLEILVVDDAEDDRRALVDMARAFGWRTDVCDSGEALVQWMTQRAASGQPLPDAMLVDWQMGGIDGLQALAELTERIGLKKLPAALMVSASEREQLMQLDTRQLASDILTKPVNASVLFNAVNHGVVTRQGNSDRVMPLRTMPGQHTLWLPDVRVLLVDDSDINLEIASHLLSREGAAVVTASSGRQALQKLEAMPDAFDVVLMDVQMPDMDGLEATRRLRQHTALLQLPVIALTAGALAEERRRAIDAGMNAFLTKPLEPQLLVRTVREVIEAATGQALAVRQADPVASATASANWPDIEGIDSGLAAQRLSGDPALLHSSLRRLFNEFGEWTQTTLPDPISPEQRTAFASKAHKLRGAAGLMAATALHQSAGEFENCLRGGEAVDQLLPHWLVIGRALHNLSVAAAPFLETDVLSPAATSAAEHAPLTGEDLVEFSALLAQQDLAALEWVQRHAPALRERLGDALHERLNRQLNDLDFAGAAALLADEIAK
ncbi:PAS domain S-box-containing protein [Hydrogenophaga palleronii]|uniref:histidine kinase n=1 Tax=Hydrogenophaga palleronii TaxID=65655 RepID=A0ABU1WUV5_9BURK|nr:PAS-domain containing protein [Hydrogenophaga palleronii]MDR7152642.1 PAS domain S-box-containing protein [Hydrogenophaga palleronii]